MQSNYVRDDLPQHEPAPTTGRPAYSPTRRLIVILVSLAVVLLLWGGYTAYSKPSTPAADVAPAIIATVAADPPVAFNGIMLQIGAVITQTTSAGAVVADAVPLNYMSERNAEGYTVTDSDGDQFHCKTQPKSVSDLNGCKFLRTVQP